MNYLDQLWSSLDWAEKLTREQCLEKFFELANSVTDEHDVIDTASSLIAVLDRLAHEAGASRTLKALSAIRDKSDISDNRYKQLNLLALSDTTSTRPEIEEFNLDFRHLAPDAQKLVERWNSILSLPRIETLRGRVTLLNRAVRSAYFRAKWSEGFEKLLSTSFLVGKNNRRWRANIDWFIAPPNLQNILEGKYDDKNKQRKENRNYDREEI